jgi:predicted phage tail protein
LTNTAVDYQSIRLNWNTYTGTGTFIEIYRNTTTNSSDWRIIATIPATQNSFISAGLNPGTRYYHRIRAVNPGGISNFTSTVSTLTLALPPIPAAPSNLQIVPASVTTTSAAITWSDNSNNETNFEVHRSLGDTESFTLLASLPANTTQYTDNTLLANSTYFYKVLSKNIGGASAFSDHLQVNSANTNPVIDPVANVVLRYSEERLIEIHASDADNDFLAFDLQLSGAESLPELAYNSMITEKGWPTSVSFRQKVISGVYENFTVYARDAFGGEDALQFNITVSEE